MFPHAFLGATPAAFGSADLGWDSGTCIAPSPLWEGAAVLSSPGLERGFSLLDGGWGALPSEDLLPGGKECCQQGVSRPGHRCPTWDNSAAPRGFLQPVPGPVGQPTFSLCLPASSRPQVLNLRALLDKYSACQTLSQSLHHGRTPPVTTLTNHLGILFKEDTPEAQHY